MMDRNKQGVVLQKEKTFLSTVALKGTRCSQAMLLTLSDRLLLFHQLPTAIESSFTIFHTFKLLLIAVWSVVSQGKRNGRWPTTFYLFFYFLYFPTDLPTANEAPLNPVCKSDFSWSVYLIWLVVNFGCLLHSSWLGPLIKNVLVWLGATQGSVYCLGTLGLVDRRKWGSNFQPFEQETVHSTPWNTDALVTDARNYAI